MNTRPNPVTCATIQHGDMFALPQAAVSGVNGQHIKTQVRKSDRARRKKFIQPKNAGFIAGHVPQDEGEIIYGLIPGNFQYGDMIPLIFRETTATEIHLSTLSMNPDNVRMLIDLRADVERMLVLVSSYWQYTDKQRVQILLSEAAKNHNFTVRHLRIHSKVVLFWSPNDCWILSGSANLRSSDSIEQFSLIKSRDIGNTIRDTYLDLAERRGSPIGDETQKGASEL